MTDWRNYEWHRCPECGKTWRGYWNPRANDPFAQSPATDNQLCDACAEDLLSQGGGMEQDEPGTRSLPQVTPREESLLTTLATFRQKVTASSIIERMTGVPVYRDVLSDLNLLRRREFAEFDIQGTQVVWSITDVGREHIKQRIAEAVTAS
jgi:hypothetical protein